MNARTRISGNLSWGLLVSTLLAGMPAAAEAGWLGFRNETNAPVVVQIAHVAGNRVQLGKPLLLLQGNVIWERVLQPGTKRITVYEPTQRRVLFQGDWLYAGNDLFFAVQVEPTPPMGVVPLPPLVAQPKLKLTPAKPPTGPGQMPPGP